MKYLGDWYLGKLVEGDSCRIAYNRGEVRGPTYQVLQDSNFSYKKLADGGIPANAVLGATLKSGKKQFSCRVTRNDRLELGRITEGANSCIISVAAKQYSYSTYEVLVR